MLLGMHCHIVATTGHEFDCFSHAQISQDCMQPWKNLLLKTLGSDSSAFWESCVMFFIPTKQVEKSSLGVFCET